MGAIFQNALSGDRPARASPGSDNDYAEIPEIDSKFLMNGAGESRAIGVESGSLSVLIENDRVHGTHAARCVVDDIAGGKCFQLVRDSDIDATKASGEHFVKSFGDFANFNFDSHITGVFSQFIKSRLMKLWRERMSNGIAYDGEVSRKVLPLIDRGKLIDRE